jgi:hypothetical protein
VIECHYGFEDFIVPDFEAQARKVLHQSFAKFAEESEWATNECDTLFLAPKNYPMPYWGDELPMTVELSPDDFRAVMEDAIADEQYTDLSTCRSNLLAWRGMIDGLLAQLPADE